MDKSTSFATSLLFFWVKGSVSVDTNLVKVSTQNSLLGFIPAGKDNQNIPLKNISSSTISSRYRIVPLILGIFLLLHSFSYMSQAFFASLIILLIAVAIISSSLLVKLTIQKSGSDYEIVVPFFEKKKLVIIHDLIEDGLINDAEKSDLQMYFDKKQ